MKSLSKYLLALVLLLSCANLFAENKKNKDLLDPPIEEIVIPLGFEQFYAPEIYLNVEGTMRSLLNYPETVFAGNLGCTAVLEHWEIAALACLEKNMFDFSTSCIFVPVITDSMDLGVNVILHTETEYKTYLDIDLLLGGYFAVTDSSHFIFDASIFYFQKHTHIFNIIKNRPWITTNDLALDLDFRFPINDYFTLGFEISSFNKTKFNSFLTPFYTFYVNYDMFENLTLNFNTQINYIDMFTLSGNLTNISLSAGVDWRLK